MNFSIDRTRRTTFLGLLLAAGVAVGCDKEETRDAAQTAGDGVEKAVTAIGDASRGAVQTIGAGVEKAGDKMQEAGHDASTRPAAATQPITLP